MDKNNEIHQAIDLLDYQPDIEEIIKILETNKTRQNCRILDKINRIKDKNLVVKLHLINALEK